MIDFPYNRIQRVDAPVRRQVEEALRRAIVKGHFGPGERLVETQLCERFGVSRPIVREALRQLVAEGLVVIVPNRGAQVASMTAEEARQIYEVRAQLEGLAGQGMAKFASASAIQELRAIVGRLEEAESSGAAAQAVLAIKQTFYAVLLENCGNGIVRETLERLNNRIGRLRALSMSQPGRLSQTVREIRAIVDAIERRDGVAAFDACVHHVGRAAEHALAALARSAPPPSPETPSREESTL